MSAMEWIGVAAVALAAVVVLWMLLKRVAGGVSTPLSEEELEALDGTAVLLADDSLTIQRVVELVFMDLPVRLRCVADGEAAASLLEEEAFDVVIADVHMDVRTPSRTGYEVCEVAKKLNPQVVVLLLVGTFEPFDDELYKKCGADEVLKKPFKSADLPRTLSRLLREP